MSDSSYTRTRLNRSRMIKITNSKLQITNKSQILFVICVLYIVIYPMAHAQEAYLYEGHGRRDPFVPLVGVTKGAVVSLEDIVSIEDVNLQGIARDSTGRKAAIINGEMIKEGQTIGHLTIIKILKNEVILTIDEDEFKVNIYGEEA